MNNAIQHPPTYTRRHSRFSRETLIEFLFSINRWHYPVHLHLHYSSMGNSFWEKIDQNSRNTAIGAVIVFGIVSFALRKLLRYPGLNRWFMYFLLQHLHMVY